MADAPPVARRGEELEPGHLLFGDDVPEAELGPQAAIVLQRHLAGHQGLGVDDPPVAEPRRLVEVADLLDEGFLRQRLEQSGTAEIAGDHAGDLGAVFRVLGRLAEEVDYRDRQRLEVTTRDVNLDQCHGLAFAGEQECGCKQCDKAERPHQPSL